MLYMHHFRGFKHSPWTSCILKFCGRPYSCYPPFWRIQKLSKDYESLFWYYVFFMSRTVFVDSKIIPRISRYVFWGSVVFMLCTIFADSKTRWVSMDSLYSKGLWYSCHIPFLPFQMLSIDYAYVYSEVMCYSGLYVFGRSVVYMLCIKFANSKTFHGLSVFWSYGVFMPYTVFVDSKFSPKIGLYIFWSYVVFMSCTMFADSNTPHRLCVFWRSVVFMSRHAPCSRIQKLSIDYLY